MAEMTYLDFDLLIEHAEQGYRSRVLNSPGGQAAADFALPFSDLELENLLLRIGQPRRPARRQVRYAGASETDALKSFGGRLFESVFSDEVRACLRSSLEEAQRQGAGLRIRLRLAEAPDLADLPWEYLYNPTLNRFLVLSVETPLVRYLDLAERIQPLAVQPPLRVLAMISSPSDYPTLDVNQEWEKLSQALDGLVRQGLVTLDKLEEATLAALQQRLRQEEYHIFHFIGHGGFDERSQDGELILEGGQGRGQAVRGQDLGVMLHDERSLRLAILNACEGARASRSDPFAGTAQSLVQQGIPAVIAMQFEITDKAAISFAQEFYRAVADGYPVDAALGEARKAIFAQGNQVEWGTPVLYMRAPDGRIFAVEKVTMPGKAAPVPFSILPRARRWDQVFNKKAILALAALPLIALLLFVGYLLLPKSPPPVSIDDFELYGSNEALRSAYRINDAWGANSGQISLALPPNVHSGARSAAFQYEIKSAAPNDYAGFERDLSPAQDWRRYSSFCVWIKSDGAPMDLVIQFREQSGEVWRYRTSLPLGIRDLQLPLDRDTFEWADWSTRDNGRIDLHAINYYGFFIGQGGSGSGTIYVDDISLSLQKSNLDVPRRATPTATAQTAAILTGEAGVSAMVKQIDLTPRASGGTAAETSLPSSPLPQATLLDEYTAKPGAQATKAAPYSLGLQIFGGWLELTHKPGIQAHLIVTNTSSQPITLTWKLDSFTLRDDRGDEVKQNQGFSCCVADGDTLDPGDRRVVRLVFDEPDEWVGKNRPLWVYLDVKRFLQIERARWRFRLPAIR